MQSSIINKSITLLDVLGDSNRPRTFTEIVRASAFSKSTVHRLLSILTTEDLVQFDTRTRTYMLGPKLLQLARKARHGFEIQSIAFEEMHRLHGLVGENITISVLQGHEVVYLRVIEAGYDWGVMQRSGMREPVHSTASGKALVAFLAPRIRSAWLDRHEFTRFTDRTITSREAFEGELETVRNAGFATSDRENVDYVSGIAAPVFNYVGDPIAALNIWAPTFHRTLPELREWSDELMSAARRVSTLIGGDGDNRPGLEVADPGRP